MHIRLIASGVEHNKNLVKQASRVAPCLRALLDNLLFI
jgi:hypothetical protein